MEFRFPTLTPAVRGILIAIAAVFAGQLIVAAATGFDESAVERWVMRPFGLHTADVGLGHVWQLVTYMWLHSTDTIWHLAFNALSLYFFGSMLESMMARNRFMRLYFLGGIAGGVCVVLWDLIWVVGLGNGSMATTVGASGAVSAVIAALCWTVRDRWLNIFITKLKGIHLLAIIVAIDIVRGLTQPNVALPAHMGGMALGIAFIHGAGDPYRWWLKAQLWRQRRKLRVIQGGQPKDDLPN